MSKLNNEDVLWCVSRLPNAVRIKMIQNSKKMILAGGFIRACIANEQVNDVDLFAPSKELAKIWAEELKKTVKVFESVNAYTIKGHKLPIQIIHRWVYETPETVIYSFDFTIAAAAIWFDEERKVWDSCCHDRYYSDLASKRLTYTSPVREEAAGGSMLRVLKFYQKGYRIPIDSLGAVIDRVFQGIDQERVKGSGLDSKRIIIGLLREVDPAIDPGHLSHLPSALEEEKLSFVAEEDKKE